MNTASVYKHRLYLATAIVLCALGPVASAHLLPGLPPTSLDRVLKPPVSHQTAGAIMAEPASVAAPKATPSGQTAFPSFIMPTFALDNLQSMLGTTNQGYVTGIDSENDVVGYVANPIVNAAGTLIATQYQGFEINDLGPGNTGPLILLTPTSDLQPATVDGQTVNASIIPTGIGFKSLYVEGISGSYWASYPTAVGYEFAAQANGVPALPEGFWDHSSSGFEDSSAEQSVGTLPGGSYSVALGIDDAANVAVGYCDTPAGTIHSIAIPVGGAQSRYPNTGTTEFNEGLMTDLGSLTFTAPVLGPFTSSNSVAYAVADFNAEYLNVAGAADNGTLDAKGNPVLNSVESFIPFTQGDPSSIGTISGNGIDLLSIASISSSGPDLSYSVAYATDPAADMAGEFYTATRNNPETHAYVAPCIKPAPTLDPGVDLGTFPAGSYKRELDSAAYGVNANGYVVGESDSPFTNDGRPGIGGFLTYPTSSHDMYNIYALVPGYTGPNIDYIGGINSSGVIVGAAGASIGNAQPVVLWPQTDGYANLAKPAISWAKSALAQDKAQPGVWMQTVRISGLPTNDTVYVFPSPSTLTAGATFADPNSTFTVSSTTYPCYTAIPSGGSVNIPFQFTVSGSYLGQEPKIAYTPIIYQDFPN